MRHLRMTEAEEATQSPFECLGVSCECSLAELHAAFVQTACGTRGKYTFKTVIAAFETLVDAKARQALGPELGSPAVAARLGDLDKLDESMLPPERRSKSANAQESQRFACLRRLRTLLSQLPREVRRRTIAEGMSQAQRVSLERWMLSEHVHKARHQPCAEPRWLHLKRGNRQLSERSLCRLSARCGRTGYRPILHLVSGFYAQAGFSFEFNRSVSALGVLVAMRSFCRAVSAVASTTCRNACQTDMLGTQAEAMRLAILTAVEGCSPSSRLQQRIYFKTRVRLSHNSSGCGGNPPRAYREASSPATTDLAIALRAWQQLFVGMPGALKHSVGVVAAHKEKRWPHFCASLLHSKVDSRTPPDGSNKKQDSLWLELHDLLQRLEASRSRSKVSCLVTRKYRLLSNPAGSSPSRVKRKREMSVPVAQSASKVMREFELSLPRARKLPYNDMHQGLQPRREGGG